MKKRKKLDPFFLLSTFVILGVVFSTVFEFPSAPEQNHGTGANLAAEADSKGQTNPMVQAVNDADLATDKQEFIQVSTKKHP